VATNSAGMGRGSKDHATDQVFRQAVPQFGLSIEKGTEAVPEDGCYHVLLEGEELLKTRSRQEAVTAYRRVRDDLVAPQTRVDVRKALMRQVAQSEAAAFLAQSSREKRARATKKGGKGGSGGIGG